MPWFEDAYHIDDEAATALRAKLAPSTITAVVGEEHAVYGTSLEAALRVPHTVAVAGDVHPLMVETHVVARRTGADPWHLPFRTWWDLPEARLLRLLSELRERRDGSSALDDLRRLYVFWTNRLERKMLDPSLLRGCTLIVHPFGASAGRTAAQKLAAIDDAAVALEARCLVTFPVPWGRASAATLDLVPELLRDRAILLPAPEIPFDDVPPF